MQSQLPLHLHLGTQLPCPLRPARPPRHPTGPPQTSASHHHPHLPQRCLLHTRPSDFVVNPMRDHGLHSLAAPLASPPPSHRTPHPPKPCRPSPHHTAPSAPSPSSTMRGQPNFDHIARPYRWLEYITLGRALEQCRLHYLPSLLNRKRALVLGDGDGRFLAQLLAQNPHLHAHAIDTSATMLQLLRHRCEAVAPNASARLNTHPYAAL